MIILLQQVEVFMFFFLLLFNNFNPCQLNFHKRVSETYQFSRSSKVCFIIISHPSLALRQTFINWQVLKQTKHEREWRHEQVLGKQNRIILGLIIFNSTNLKRCLNWQVVMWWVGLHHKLNSLNIKHFAQTTAVSFNFFPSSSYLIDVKLEAVFWVIKTVEVDLIVKTNKLFELEDCLLIEGVCNTEVFSLS